MKIMRILSLLALTGFAFCSFCACAEDSAGAQGSGGNQGAQEEDISPKYALIGDDALAAAGLANDDAYCVGNVVARENSKLAGKTFYWLGSSVTFGSASEGESMADFLEALTGCVSVKEAMSGTTILDDGRTDATGRNSYTRRLKNSTAFKKDAHVDAFICQISTNDCTSERLSKRGVMTDENVIDINEFDLSTTLGGVEFIIAYVTETWHCPVYFYSGAYFTDGSNKAKRQNNNPKGSDYGELVEQVKRICEKWNEYYDYKTGVIDLFNDQEFNAVASEKYYSWATNDPIHPKKAGYLQWWTPYFESFLLKELK